jgi:hypothetical protein
VAQAYLRQFLASPPGQRQQMLPGVPGTPWTEQYVGTVVQVANTCNNY